MNSQLAMLVNYQEQIHRNKFTLLQGEDFDKEDLVGENKGFSENKINLEDDQIAPIKKVEEGKNVSYSGPQDWRVDDEPLPAKADSF